MHLPFVSAPLINGRGTTLTGTTVPECDAELEGQRGRMTHARSRRRTVGAPSACAIGERRGSLGSTLYHRDDPLAMLTRIQPGGRAFCRRRGLDPFDLFDAVSRPRRVEPLSSGAALTNHSPEASKAAVIVSGMGRCQVHRPS